MSSFLAGLGGIVSAAGLTALAWTTSAWLGAGGNPSPWPFLLGTLLALGALLALGRRPPEAAAPTRGLWRLFTRTTLATTVVLFMGSSCLSRTVDTKGAAYRASMRYDLRLTLAAEDSAFIRSGRYTADLDTLFGPKRRYGPPSAGVLGPEIALTADGWTAEVRHNNIAGRCAIFVGSTPLAPAVREREPVCERPRGPLPVAAYFKALLIVAGGLALAGLAVRWGP